MSDNRHKSETRNRSVSTAALAVAGALVAAFALPALYNSFASTKNETTQQTVAPKNSAHAPQLK